MLCRDIVPILKAAAAESEGEAEPTLLLCAIATELSTLAGVDCKKIPIDMLDGELAVLVAAAPDSEGRVDVVSSYEYVDDHDDAAAAPVSEAESCGRDDMPSGVAVVELRLASRHALAGHMHEQAHCPAESKVPIAEVTTTPPVPAAALLSAQE
jgi:hypothetical protein